METLAALSTFYPPHEQWLAPTLRALGLFAPGPPVPILEVGCGGGRTLRFLAVSFPTSLLFGVDIDAERIAAARLALGDRADLVTCDASAYVPACRFGLIVFHLALHDMTTVAAAKLLRRSMQWLRPGGCIVVVEILDYLADPELLFAEAGFASADVRIPRDGHVVVAYYRAA